MSRSDDGLTGEEPLAPNTETLSGSASAPGDELAIENIDVGAVVLDKYRVERRIGGGGMADVYEATHLTLGTRVALKFPLGRLASPRRFARILREAQVSASLDPDRVVRVLDVASTALGVPVIVMELLEGESLADRLAREGKLAPAVAARWVREACLGLVEAHARGIVHRDIKPSNLFVERRRGGVERLKLLDFGVASIRAAASQQASAQGDSGAVGSPPYMAPEQLNPDARSPQVDARCDVWALGVTLFELCAGRRPFVGKPVALVSSILNDASPTLEDVGVSAPEPLKRVIARCLEKDREERFRDAQALADALEGFAAPAPLSSRVAPPSARVPRRRAFAWIAIAVVVTAILTTIVLLGWAR
ncbi:MAG: serine/threonine-protein kinase [Polyangiaceae bacterium]